MNAIALINNLQAHDVEIWAEEDMIKWNSPRGPVNPSIKQQMAKQKREILTLLKSKQPNHCKRDKSPQPLDPKEKPIVQAKREGKTPLSVLKPQQSNDAYLNKILLGNCLEQLKKLSDNSIDSIVTDPPYGIQFMSKDWDKALPDPKVWEQCYRVLKPGSFAFVMCGPRQNCLARMMINLEDAGFKINFTSMYWAYASGFPKAHNIKKSLKKTSGIEPRELKNAEGAYAGFQPKPAVEVIIVAMKPMDKNTYKDQILSNGKGVTWLDNCRIPYNDENEKWIHNGRVQWSPDTEWSEARKRSGDKSGRFPANLLVSDDILDIKSERSSRRGIPYVYPDKEYEVRGFLPNCKPQAPSNYNDDGGFSRFFSLDTWADRNLENIPEDVQKTFPFLAVPKASRKEKDDGLNGIAEKAVKGRDPIQDKKNVPFKARTTPRKNIHPTVKPIKLMSYLITLGSREGDVILDPFCGSGTTCVAGKMLGRQFIGIEIDPEYHEIAVRRVECLGSDKEINKKHRRIAN